MKNVRYTEQTEEVVSKTNEGACKGSQITLTNSLNHWQGTFIPEEGAFHSCFDKTGNKSIDLAIHFNLHIYHLEYLQIGRHGETE